ncbi:diaminopimelate epimerase [Nakamurella sp. UYEF19]|uniref:diaminopimelate epimerase n=1 Tax=Nakamurella sp. UYEF19 TaxID=1756392 RepID=UPI0033965943
MQSGGVRFLKGHGTQNDFVLIPDLDDALSPTAAQVIAICDRRAGIGGDGLIRIAPEPGGGYFMDYRNADGSLAEMCGNGARLFARYLVDAGLQQPGSFEFGTRGGVRTAQLEPAGDVSIGMGPANVGAESKAELGGQVYSGTAVDVGNPHLVCLLDASASSTLAALDLSAAPHFDADVFPHGVNIEFVVPLGADRVRMRVFERGVGETRSCGTGTVAVAAAFRHSLRIGSAIGRPVGDVGPVTVDVPGGTVCVSFEDGQDGGATLTGPAVIVAQGVIEQDFWDRHR